jgi:hypothetical protein
MTMSVATPVKTVGSKKAAAECAALGAGDDLGAFFQSVGDMRLDLLDRLRVDQRADHRTRLEPGGELHRASGLGQVFAKGVADAILQ